MKNLFITSLVLILTSCTGLPENIQPVKNFDSQRYLGNWYEIARLDHSFERGLSNVTANYTKKKDGGIRVINKGFSTKENAWSVAEGKAYFVDDDTTGHLKVSFFGPFYGSYVVFKMDEINYEYAYVTSYKRDFLWLLSRTPEISETIKEDFLNTAKENNFNVNEIIFVNHIPPPDLSIKE